jgi:hypothetical protein
MNVCINVMYRDAANYKNDRSFLVTADADDDIKAMAERIRGGCDTNHNFIAKAVGLDLEFGEGAYDSRYDHCYHEYNGVSTDPMYFPIGEPLTTLKELVAKFDSIEDWTDHEYDRG